VVSLQPIDINDPKYFCVQDGKKRKLRVANISSKDEGFYKCKVQDKVTSAKLYVARKSRWSRISHFQSVFLSLLCTRLNHNQRFFYHMTTSLRSSASSTIAEGFGADCFQACCPCVKMSLPRVFGDSRSAIVIVADVIIKEPLKNLRMVEGEVAKMQCKVKNPKNYPITWLRNGEEIKVPSDKFVISNAAFCSAFFTHYGIHRFYPHTIHRFRSPHRLCCYRLLVSRLVFQLTWKL